MLVALQKEQGVQEYYLITALKVDSSVRR